MKRFLSVLLSAMLLLSSISITAFADDAPPVELTLKDADRYATSSYAVANPPFNKKQQDKKIIFNAVEEVAGYEVRYTHNKAVVTPSDSPVANTVALPVSPGVNRYTAQLCEGDIVKAESKPVYIYGATTGEASGNTYSHAWASGKKSMTIDSGMKAKLAEEDPTAIALYEAELNPETGLYESDKAVYYSTRTSAIGNTRNARSPSYYTTTNNREMSYVQARLFINGNPKNSVATDAIDISNSNAGEVIFMATGIGIGSTTSSDNAPYKSKLYISSTNEVVAYGTLSGKYNTGVTLDSGRWYDVEAYFNFDEMSVDYYIDNVLVGKYTALDDAAMTTGNHSVHPYADPNIFYDTFHWDDFTAISIEPSLTAEPVAAEEGSKINKITYTATQMDEFYGYKLGVLVDGELIPGSDIDFTAESSNEISFTVPRGKKGAEVQVAAIDADGNILPGLYGGLKSAPVSMDLEGTLADPLLLTLNTSAARTISGTLTAEVDSWVLFNAPAVAEGTSVKYYRNDVEVIPLSTDLAAGTIALPAGTVALPVSAGQNKYTVKQFDANDEYVKGTESEPVYVNGLSLPAVVEDAGYYVNSRFTAVNDEEILSALGQSNVGRRATSTFQAMTNNGDADPAFKAFSVGEYESIKYSVDAYYKLINNQINGGSVYQLMGMGGSRSAESYISFVRIDDGGNISIGSDSENVATGAVVPPNSWHSYEFYMKKNGLVDLYIDDVLVVIDKDIPTTYVDGAYIWAGDLASANNEVYYSGNYKKYTLHDYVITGSAADGSVEIPKYALKSADQGEVIAVVGRRADDSVKAQTFSFTSDIETVNLGESFKNIFVWTWDALKPLCDVIDE